MLLQACLNGARPPRAHPRLPTTPEALARDAAACVAAGAASLHLHPRGPDGRETLAPAAIAAAVEAVRAAAPGVELSVSTGLWITGGDATARAAQVSAWEVLPDAASVNVVEEGWVELCQLLADRGVRVEIGIRTATAAEAFAAAALEETCVRALVEPQEAESGAAIVTAAAIDRMLGQGGVRLPRLHHGTDATTWAVLDAAVPAGRDVRIGLEDTLVLPEGARAPSNEALVRAAVERYAAA